MSTIKQIVEGWKNVLIKNDDVEAVSASRLSICLECPFYSENAKKTGYASIRIDEHCTRCGCPLLSKTRCMTCECPEKKWLAHEYAEKS